MGEGAVGCSLSLVASGEDKFHAKIVNALKVSFTEVVMDGRLLSGAQERVNLACKVASAEDTERKTQRDNQWFKDQAAEAGLEVDDDMLDNGLAGGDSRDQARLNEARLARERLRHLLAQPIQTQRFGKFLSTNSAATQRVVPEPVIMPPAPGSRKKKRRRSK
jgi:ATP-dependent RNA helicase DDX24/MAK5